ncbi:hypothetical protein [Micromonospora zhanjiangensis]
MLLGDNPQSYDSRHFGYCPGELLVGVVVRRIVKWKLTTKEM